MMDKFDVMDVNQKQREKIDLLEQEVKRQQDIGLVLADRLNEKIDECEKLMRENNRLRILLGDSNG